MDNFITTTIDMIRHGEPVGGKKYRGQIDDPLSEKGWQQMREAVGEHCPWDTIITSPLSRCSAFAEEIAQRHQRPLQVEPRLKEIAFGAWEGKTATELLAEDDKLLAHFWSDPLNHTPPGAEPLAVFRDRIVAAWNDLLQQHAGKHLLIVGHAGQMRMVIRHVLDMPLDRLFRIQVDNAALTRIQVDSAGHDAWPRLIFHNGRLA